MSEKIKEAAILYKGKIYSGFAHHIIGLKMVRDGVCPRPYPCGKAQGFVTTAGRFVSREEALQIAIEQGQVVEGKTENSVDLYSEDLRKHETQ